MSSGLNHVVVPRSRWLCLACGSAIVAAIAYLDLEIVATFLSMFLFKLLLQLVDNEVFFDSLPGHSVLQFSLGQMSCSGDETALVKSSPHCSGTGGFLSLSLASGCEPLTRHTSSAYAAIPVSIRRTRSGRADQRHTSHENRGARFSRSTCAGRKATR